MLTAGHGSSSQVVVYGFVSLDPEIILRRREPLAWDWMQSLSPTLLGSCCALSWTSEQVSRWLLFSINHIQPNLPDESSNISFLCTPDVCLSEYYKHRLIADATMANSLHGTMGVVFVGAICDAILYGIVIFQTYRYFGGRNDGLGMRVLVSLLCLLDTLQLILIGHALYYFFDITFLRCDCSAAFGVESKPGSCRNCCHHFYSQMFLHGTLMDNEQ